MSHFKRSQSKYVKKSYKVRNWSDYEASLCNRGSLTVWLSDEDLSVGQKPETRKGKRKPGRQPTYTHDDIETSLTIGMVYHLHLRQAEGFLRSLFDLLGVNRLVPDHTTVSRRTSKLGKVPIFESESKKGINVIIDSSGVKVHAGSMRKPPSNRDWRKLHIGIDEETGDIVACDLTSKGATDSSRVPSLLKQIDRPLASARADSAYDTQGVYEAVEAHTQGRSPRVLIPPKKGARLRPKSSTSRERNRNIRSRARLGKRKWHTESGYSKRCKGETTFYRYKGIIGPAMHARRLANQRVEARIGCKIVNTMTALGMPDGYMVG
jgi:hypothetical protein